MKVSELEGKELDNWVAKADGWKHLGAIGLSEPDEKKPTAPFCKGGMNDWWESPRGHKVCGPCSGIPYEYSSDWSHGGPIIEREKIELIYFGTYGKKGSPWEAQIGCDTHYIDQYSGDATGGPTPLIAAMRAFVYSKFGEEVNQEKQ